MFFMSSLIITPFYQTIMTVFHNFNILHHNYDIFFHFWWRKRVSISSIVILLLCLAVMFSGFLSLKLKVKSGSHTAVGILL